MSIDLLNKLAFEPNLLTPGVKPVGGVESPETTLAALFRGGYVDLNNNYQSTSITPGVSFNDESVSFDGTAGNKIQLDRPIGNPDEFTIVFRFRQNAANNHGIFSDRDLDSWSLAKGVSVNIRNDGGVLFYVGSNETFSRSDYFGDGLYHTVICRLKVGEMSTIHIDGAEILYDGQGIQSAYSSSSINARIGTYYSEADIVSANGDLDFLDFIPRRISDSEITEISHNPYSILTTQHTLPLAFTVVGGGLVVQSLRQSQSLGSPILTQHSAIAVDSARQSQTIGVPTLAQHGLISPNGVRQAMTLDQSVILQQHQLAVDAVSQGQTIDSSGLTVSGALSPDGLAQSQTLDPAIIQSSGVLFVNDLLQISSLDAVTLTEHGVLSPASLTQTQAVSIPDITQNNVLVVASLNQVQNIDIVLLSEHNILIVDDLSQVQTMTTRSQVSVSGWLRGELVIISPMAGALDISLPLDWDVSIN